VDALTRRRLHQETAARFMSLPVDSFKRLSDEEWEDVAAYVRRGQSCLVRFMEAPRGGGGSSGKALRPRLPCSAGTMSAARTGSGAGRS
jgi:hypothetical protein